jgi:hypothetical protein
LRGDRLHQSLARALRGLRTGGGESEQRQIGAQGFQLATALAARAQMRLEFGTGLVVERAHGV